MNGHGIQTDQVRSFGMRVILAGVILLACGGCIGDALGKLPRDADMPEHGPLVAAAQKLAMRTTLVGVGEAGGKTIRLAAHEVGAGKAQRVAVLVHGIISDSRMWRYIRPQLAEMPDVDVMEIDLLGSGRSDCPEPKIMGSDGYGPTALARGVLMAMRQRLSSYPSNTRVTLIGHSLGGMIILRMYAEESLRNEFADVISRVDGAVLFTPVDVQITTDHPTFAEIAYTNDFTFWLAARLGILHEKIALASMAGVVDPKLASREEADRMVEILDDPRRRHAAQAMIVQAVPRVSHLRGSPPDWPAIRRLVAGYSKVSVPSLIVWGECDDTFPLSMGYKLAYEVPQARLRIVEQSMHSIPCEHPKLSAKMIRDFIANGPPEPKIARMDVQTHEATPLLNWQVSLTNAPPPRAPAARTTPVRASVLPVHAAVHANPSK